VPCRRILEQLAAKEQPACSLAARYPAAIRTYIHSWKHLSDVGVQLLGAQEQLALEAAAAASQLPAWRPGGQQQLSLQEEGEVEGEGEGADTTSLLLPGETADEDLLQGLLEDDKMAGWDEEPADQGYQGQQQQGEAGRGGHQQQGQQAAAAAAAEAGAGAGAGAGGYNGLGDEEFGELLAEEVSMGSELLPGEGGGDGGGLGASGPGRALQAAHSLYRLVLRTTALEVHLHVKVFFSYPLCPPVFSVTKMLDTSSRGDAVPLTDVNEVLQLQQQVRGACRQQQDWQDCGCWTLATHDVQYPLNVLPLEGTFCTLPTGDVFHTVLPWPALRAVPTSAALVDCHCCATVSPLLCHCPGNWEVWGCAQHLLAMAVSAAAAAD
jgi:hypothetical protein